VPLDNAQGRHIGITALRRSCTHQVVLGAPEDKFVPEFTKSIFEKDETYPELYIF